MGRTISSAHIFSWIVCPTVHGVEVKLRLQQILIQTYRISYSFAPQILVVKCMFVDNDIRFNIGFTGTSLTDVSIGLHLNRISAVDENNEVQ